MGRFCPHMVQLLSEWMETFPYDFRDERVMAHVRQLTQRCVALDTSLRRDVSQMLHNLLRGMITWHDTWGPRYGVLPGCE